jgi:bifunctional non-homologous end joining protein LigD
MLLPELGATMPANLQLDGEIVALNAEGLPDFHRLGTRMLHGRMGVRVTYFVFDVLAVEGLPTTVLPYSERRALLEELDIEGPYVRLVATFEDGQALFDAVCTRGLEGVVAKREREPYRPGERIWVKVKNRETRRFAEELEGVRRAVAMGRRSKPSGADAARSGFHVPAPGTARSC